MWKRKVMFKYIKSIQKRDPASKNFFTVLFLYPCVHAIFWHRIAHFLYKIKFCFLARLISQIVRLFTQIEIHPQASIGKNLFIDHACGVVIGQTTIIGNDCTLYQNVTLGGISNKNEKRHPTLCDNVTICAGAKVLGNIIVKSGAVVGANAVVLKNVDENQTVVGVPARAITKKDKKT